MVMTAVRWKGVDTGYPLEYASAELKGDQEIVLEAVKRSGRALACASKELQVTGVVTKAVNRRGAAVHRAQAAQ